MPWRTLVGRTLRHNAARHDFGFALPELLASAGKTSVGGSNKLRACRAASAGPSDGAVSLGLRWTSTKAEGRSNDVHTPLRRPSNLFTSPHALSHVKVGERVRLAGWLIQIRIVSKFLAFAVLLLPRGQGQLQLLVRKEDESVADGGVVEAWEKAGLHGVVEVEGIFADRPESAKMVSVALEKDQFSQFELQVDACTVLNPVLSNDLPFNPTDVGRETREEVRLRHRHLDLRRPSRGANVRLRSKVTWAARKFLHESGFDEVETPILLRSTPEGAREYLVPARTTTRLPESAEQHTSSPHFYALQQSPQQPKQLLMVSGVTDRYFQIARCFRDEDGRKDRQPEFTQIDLEMSFIAQHAERDDWPLGGQEVRSVVEGLIKEVWKAAGRWDELKDVQYERGFRVMRYEEAMQRFGSDKPDLRLGMEIGQLGDVLCASKEEKEGRTGEIEALCFTLPELSMTRKDLETAFGQDKTITDGVEMFWGRPEAPNELSKLLLRKSSVIRSFLQANEVETADVSAEGLKEEVERLRQKGRMTSSSDGGDDGRICLFLAPRSKIAQGGATKLGEVRKLLIQEMEKRGLPALKNARPEFVWIVGFPLFTRADDDKNVLSQGRWNSSHHPFTSPMHADVERVKLLLSDDHRLTKEEETDLASVKGQHYDLVLNGVEIGGGSVRIHDAELQRRIFKNMLQLSDEELSRFSHLLRALRHGAPPHAGIALGLDRLMAILCNTATIRDVIAFPKSAQGRDLLFGSPASIDQQNAGDPLHIYGLRAA